MKFLSILFLFLWVLKFCLATFGHYYFLEGSVWMSNYASLRLYIFQVVQWLLDSEPLKILFVDRGLLYGKRKNLGGDTAFDILERQTLVVDNRRIRYMLRQNRFVRRLVHYLIFPNQFFMMWVVEIGRQQTSITDERRNALLVVAVLLVTVTYQAALLSPISIQPPDQDQKPNQFNCTVPPINATGANHFNCIAGQFNASQTGVIHNLLLPAQNHLFYFLNSLTYFLTNVALLLLLPPDFTGTVLSFLLFLLLLCYRASKPILVEPDDPTAWLVFIFLSIVWARRFRSFFFLLLLYFVFLLMLLFYGPSIGSFV